jgi:hypothetical protein
MVIRTLIGSLVFGIVGVVCLPIIDDMITAAAFAGTLGTIMENVPIFYALSILVGVVAGVYYGLKSD